MVTPSKSSVTAHSDPQDRSRERCCYHFLSLPSDDWSLKWMLPSKKEHCNGVLPSAWPPTPLMLPFQGFVKQHYTSDWMRRPVTCWFNKRHRWNKLSDSKSMHFLLLAESETSHCSPLLPLKTVPGIDVNWLQSIWPTKQGSEKLQDSGRQSNISHLFLKIRFTYIFD